MDASPTPSSADTLIGSPAASKSSSPALDAEKAVVSHPLAALSESTGDVVQLTGAFQADVVDLPVPPREFSTADLRVIRALGNGAFGTVLLVQDRETEELLALKSIPKHTIETKSYANVFAEQDVLKRLAGKQGLLSLRASFEDDFFFHFLTVSRTPLLTKLHAH